jgi:Raf kinase inhibitor-like YbhB/YbcL family protein
MSFRVVSSAFVEGGAIPREYTCEGPDVSPPLEWSAAPLGTQSFAIIVDDLDAPSPGDPAHRWAHWVVYDIPARVFQVPAAASGTPMLWGGREGRNDWFTRGYRGPAPPGGRHRYAHRIFALDVVLGDLGAPTAVELLKHMAGHTLGEAKIIGLFERAAPRHHHAAR